MREPLESYSAYLDGHCLSDAEVEALRAWIGASEQNAVEFVEFAALHAAVTERLRLDRLLDDLASHRTAGGISTTLLASAIREIELSSPRVLERQEPALPAASEDDPSAPTWWAAATYAALAATLLLAVWGFWRQQAELPLPQVAVDLPAAPVAAEPEEQGPQLVATLATSFDAVWAGDLLAREQAMFAGDSISLLSGAAQFEMAGGAIVVVEGPSDVKLTGPDALRLLQGKAAVRVADHGVPFVVDTPSMQVVDLGTEFGVEATPAGAAQVMVFDGVVAIGEAGDGDAPEAAAAVAAQAPRLEAGYQVSVDVDESVLARAAQPGMLANERHFLRPDEIEVRHRALAGSLFDRRLAEHFERQRIAGLYAYQPFDPGSLGREFSIGMNAQSPIAVGAVSFAGKMGRGAIDVQNGPAFVCLDTSPTGAFARAKLLKPNGLIGETGRELWLMWTTKRLSVGPKEGVFGSAGVSLMFGDRSDVDEPIFIGRGFGATEELCVQSAWGGAPPPHGERIDVDLAAADGQAVQVDDVAHRWLARLEFLDGVDRVSVWIDQDPESVDLAAPHARIDAADVEFDRIRLAVNRDEEVWRFSDFAVADDPATLAQIKKVGDFHIDH
jgi:hypothetical protein